MTNDPSDGPIVYEIRYHPGAEQDLQDIYGRIRADIGPETAWAYVEELRDEIEGLSHCPQRGRDRSREDMHVRLVPSFDGRYNYVIRIYDEEKVVQVGRVWGGDTEPPLNNVRDGLDVSE